MGKAQDWLALINQDEDEVLKQIASQKSLIPGYIPQQSLGFLFGKSGLGKSFIALDIAHSIATGREWLCPFHMASESRLVLYIAAEGGKGMFVRKRALEERTALPAPTLKILPASPLVDTEEDGEELATLIADIEKQEGQKVALVILDTLSQTASGEENSNTAMAAYIRQCTHIMQCSGNAFLIVHHSGLQEENRMRGASSLKAGADYELALLADKSDQIQLVQMKNKDEEKAEPLLLELEKVTIDGLIREETLLPFTSLVVNQVANNGIQTPKSEVAAKLVALLGDGQFQTANDVYRYLSDEGCPFSNSGRTIPKIATFIRDHFEGATEFAKTEGVKAALKQARQDFKSSTIK